MTLLMVAAPAGPRALLAEPDEAVRALLGDVLKAAGCSVDTESEGMNVLGRAGSGDYDLVIVGSRLGSLSGAEVVGRLRDAGAGLPVILVCDPAVPGERLEEFAFARHADLLRKPFGIGDLRSSLRRVLGL
jgi:DNA-binding response OmpR family regulator